MTAVFADFTQVDELVERAVTLEIVIRAGHLDRDTLDRQPDMLIAAAIQLWLEKILPFEEYATPDRYLSEKYTDAPDAHLLHWRLRVAAERVAALYGRGDFLSAVCERVDAMPHVPDADLLAAALLCECAGGAS